MLVLSIGLSLCNICAVCVWFLSMQVIVSKLCETDGSKAALLPFADQLMQNLLSIFQQQSNSVHEEAILTVGAFTYACGRAFNKYLQAFYPFLKMGLMNHQEWQVG